MALNLSEFASRCSGPASLIAEFDNEDIKQSTHLSITIAPHLSPPISVVIGEDNSFQEILEGLTTAPARKITQFNLQSGGDVIFRICEDIRQIVVELVERQVNSRKGEDNSEEGEDDEEEEEERNRVLKVH